MSGVSITGLHSIDLGTISSPSNLPFKNIVISNAPSTDTYTVTVSTGGIYLNDGTFIGSSYSGTVNDGVLSTLRFGEGNGDASLNVVVSNGSANPAATGSENIFCFVTGTMIDCPGGSRAIETIKAGELVLNAAGSALPVVFVGHRQLDAADLLMHRPVRVPAGALADGVPARDLLVSPDHALRFDGVLVPARNLIGGPIRQVDVSAVTYYHIQLARHDVIIAEGAACETLLDTDDHSFFDNAEEAVASDVFLTPCLPRLTQGPALDLILAAISARLSVPA